jgi:hypothetical protein
MINTWIVHNFPYVLRRANPTALNVAEPYIWINAATERAFVLYGGIWSLKNPDKTIITDSGFIYVIDDISSIITEYVTMQGEIVTIGGEQATW